MKSSIVQSSAVALVTLYYPGQVFSARSARFWETCTSSMAVVQIPGKIVLNLNFHAPCSRSPIVSYRMNDGVQQVEVLDTYM